MLRCDAVARAGTDIDGGDREAEEHTSGKPDVPSMTGSTEGTRGNNRSHSSYTRHCSDNRSPLAIPIQLFSQHVFRGYGLGAIYPYLTATASYLPTHLSHSSGLSGRLV
jgi:hypothetical protein